MLGVPVEESVREDLAVCLTCCGEGGCQSGCESLVLCGVVGEEGRGRGRGRGGRGKQDCGGCGSVSRVG